MAAVMDIDGLFFKRCDIERGIEYSTKYFEHYVQKIKKSRSLKDKLYNARRAIRVANRGSTGYMSSDAIEGVFCQIARENHVPLAHDFQPGTVLHVATGLFETGGHSRIVERWIEQSDPAEQHSVILTNGGDVPARVVRAVADKGGRVIKQNRDDTDLQRGLELRRIASHYERVVLHINMDDTVPLIAFGTDEFQRPVIFFNHADHRFWLGVSIADVVVNFRDFGEQICTRWRGTQPGFFLPLPLNTNTAAKNIKCAHDVPQNRPIIFTGGSPFKYSPLMGLNFTKYMAAVIREMPDILFITVGMNQRFLPQIADIPQKNLMRHDLMPHECFLGYMNKADLVVDSFPFSGGTMLLDAVSLGKPILSLNCPVGQLNYITRSDAYCDDIKQMVDKTCRILRNSSAAAQNVADVRKCIDDENSVLWTQRLAKLNTLVSRHRVHTFKSVKKPIDMLDMFMYKNTTAIKIKFCVPRLVTLVRLMVCGRRRYKFIFGAPKPLPGQG